MNDQTHAHTLHAAQKTAEPAPVVLSDEQIAANLAAAKAAAIEKIRANFDNKFDIKEVSFHFKTKELEDASGKKTGDKFKRPTVETHIPVPSVEGIVAIFEKGGKELEYLLEVASDAVIARVRDYINENEDASQDNLPFEKFTWEFISNLPRSERRGAGIAKEIWDDFGTDYAEVMPAVTGKSAEHIGNAVGIYMKKFSTCKTNKPVLNKLKEQLTLYATNSPKAEQFAECVDFLTNKIDTLLKVDEAELLANL